MNAPDDFGASNCPATYEAVEERMDEGDPGCPVCGLAPGWHLHEEEYQRDFFA
jgi:hypothetical protein